MTITEDLFEQFGHRVVGHPSPEIVNPGELDIEELLRQNGVPPTISTVRAFEICAAMVDAIEQRNEVIDAIATMHNRDLDELTVAYCQLFDEVAKTPGSARSVEIDCMLEDHRELRALAGKFCGRPIQL